MIKIQKTISYKLVNIGSLKEHEMISSDHFSMLRDEIRNNRYIVPIIVEAATGIILDGHHRFNAIKALGLSKIPAYVVDYTEVEVTSWTPDVRVTKEEVIRRGLSGNLFPPKTSRHLHNFDKPHVPLEVLE